jgi:thiamine biosynthesis lipoprotein
MAMPLELSRQKIKEIEDIEVLIMYLDENGILQFLKSDGFDQYLKK